MNDKSTYIEDDGTLKVAEKPTSVGTSFAGTAPTSSSAAVQLTSTPTQVHRYVSIANDLTSGDYLYAGFDPAMTILTAPYQFEPGFGDNIAIDDASKIYVLGGPAGSVKYRAAVL